ncbi:His-Xaa-Ser system protein HxsD [Chitinophaga eiseniae]|uniref:His-Xaa-Ser system protein HxsD n=1 Tax=Chitinophaga eiseniae TaxID=634771 RepID=A0A1T4MKH9_9BACT|nr:His-Xaa-Ser system protein HxsD [Chitinophaga eiseniae]SJZ67502.1 His-Xaa-Ser system protein HxsD [Chitinophaga eiseniae]
MEVLQNDKILKVAIDAEIYPEVVLLKCLYWYSNTFEVDVRKSSTSQYEISLKAIRHPDKVDWAIILLKLKQDLIDFKLRQHITDETKTIRELIIAKAFIYYDQQEGPVSEITDPVGFNPQSVKV